MLNLLRPWRERGWREIAADEYAAVWQRFGGSVATHPQVVERLAGLVGIPVRYLGWPQGGELVAALPTWGRHLALSRQVLKRRGLREAFDLGNAEIILPLEPEACVPVRHLLRYVSELNAGRIATLRPQAETLSMARPPEDYGRKFRYNQRRELRLLEEAGGELRPVLALSAQEQARIYAELFRRRWGFEVPGGARLAEVFGLMREFMTGSVAWLDGEAIAIQILYRVESPGWVSVEYVNGGVDPGQRDFSPGSVLSFANTQQAWEDARALGKPLRYSFGRSDAAYKALWCHEVPVWRT